MYFSCNGSCRAARRGREAKKFPTIWMNLMITKWLFVDGKFFLAHFDG
jgi:hypothetical protein